MPRWHLTPVEVVANPRRAALIRFSINLRRVVRSGCLRLRRRRSTTTSEGPGHRGAREIGFQEGGQDSDILLRRETCALHKVRFISRFCYGCGRWQKVILRIVHAKGAAHFVNAAYQRRAHYSLLILDAHIPPSSARLHLTPPQKRRDAPCKK